MPVLICRFISDKLISAPSGPGQCRFTVPRSPPGHHLYHTMSLPRGSPPTILASLSLSISFTMNSCFSGACRHAFCLTGRAPGHTAKWCSITSLGTLGISDGVHANMSALARRKATSALSYLGVRLPPMVTVAPAGTAPEPLEPMSSGTFFTDVFSCENSCFFLAGPAS